MTEPHLLAIIAYGKPAFDIGYKMECPICGGDGEEGDEPYLCEECSGSGFWWITTYGHRARPYQYWDLNELSYSPTENDPKIPFLAAVESIMVNLANANWPDHFQSSIDSTPTTEAEKALVREGLAGLGLLKPQVPMKRRAL